MEDQCEAYVQSSPQEAVAGLYSGQVWPVQEEQQWLLKTTLHPDDAPRIPIPT